MSSGANISYPGLIARTTPLWNRTWTWCSPLTVCTTFHSPHCSPWKCILKLATSVWFISSALADDGRVPVSLMATISVAYFCRFQPCNPLKWHRVVSQQRLQTIFGTVVKIALKGGQTPNFRNKRYFLYCLRVLTVLYIILIYRLDYMQMILH